MYNKGSWKLKRPSCEIVFKMFLPSGLVLKNKNMIIKHVGRSVHVVQPSQANQMDIYISSWCDCVQVIEISNKYHEIQCITEYNKKNIIIAHVIILIQMVAKFFLYQFRNIMIIIII